MRLILSALILCLAVPAFADTRPLPRPAAIAAFAGGTDIAPRRSLRPLRSPDVVPTVQPLPLRLPTPALPPLSGARADTPLLPALAALVPTAPGHLSGLQPVVTRSAANAPRPVAVAAAVQAVFVASPGPALQPRQRPVAQGSVQIAALTIAPRLRPAARPALRAEPAPVATAEPVPVATVEPVPAVAAPALAVPAERIAQIAPRPAQRPAGLSRRAARLAAKEAARTAALQVDPDEAQVVKTAAVRIKPGEQLVKPKRGSVCGDRRIRGESIPPIPAKIKGCGIAAPVRVNEIDGVRLSPAATMDCTTAAALKDWIQTGLKPAAGKQGVAQINVAAHYACRTRNNRPGAKISEHGRGKAIDIASVVLGNGTLLDVLSHYRRDAGRVLRSAHKAACGIFGTTLGPGSDGYHENHLHFDTANHRGGAYCR